ncbi:MAG: flagellar biosynthesis protein FliQ [Erysipelothrix sp.]|jgi:flagellar biosynthetic protein FliQ|nr:flagellar biosynthesis protein FliQ [Erysipelothrix sp.]
MGSGDIMMVFQEGMMVLLKIAGPILLASIIVGLIVAIFQAATQIHEQTLTFVPKLAIIGIILLLSGGWMMRMMVEYVQMLFNMIASL